MTRELGCVVVAVSSALLVSCSGSGDLQEPPEEVATTEQAILETPHLLDNSCADYETVLAQVMKNGRIAVRSTAYDQCMRDAMANGITTRIPTRCNCNQDCNGAPGATCQGGICRDASGQPFARYGSYLPHAGDASPNPLQTLPEQIRRVLTYSEVFMPSKTFCWQHAEPPAGARGIVGGQSHWEYNQIPAIPGFAERFGLASVAWHEHLHNMTYSHGQICGGSDPWPPYRSVNEIAGKCVHEVLRRSRQHCADGSVEEPTGAEIGQPLVTCGTSGYRMIARWIPNNASPGCHCVEDVVAQNESRDLFGANVASGDFNADGFKDLAVSAVGEDDGAGNIFVYRGTSVGLRFWRLLKSAHSGNSYEAGDTFGGSLAVGDFNNDNRDDLAVGLPGEDVGTAADTGRVLIIPGCHVATCSNDGLQPGWAQELRQTLSGEVEESDDQFGFALAAGDFDRDGRTDDLAVGAPFEDLVATNSGAVFIFRGKSTRASSRNFVDAVTVLRQTKNPAETEGTNEVFGYALTFLDLDCDSFRDELAIGAPGESDNLGKVSVATYSNGTFSLPMNQAGLDAGGMFGRSLVGGKFRGADACEDLAVGAPGANNTTGAVLTIKGSSAGGCCIQHVDATPPDGSLFGYSLARVCDNSLLGTCDAILIGAPLANSWQGAIYETWSLSDSVSSFPTWNQDTFAGFPGGTAPLDGLDWTPPEDGGLMGITVASGDFDGDGIEDWAAGIPVDWVNEADATNVTGDAKVDAGSVMIWEPWDAAYRLDQATRVFAR